MFYQVRANLYFTEWDEAKAFYRDCVLAFAKSQVINPADANAEWGTTELIENHHDDDPNAPCVLIRSESNIPAP